MNDQDKILELSIENSHYFNLIGNLQDENCELKNEVEKLNKINDHLVNQLMHALEIKHESSDNTK